MVDFNQDSYLECAKYTSEFLFWIAAGFLILAILLLLFDLSLGPCQAGLLEQRV